MIDNISLDYYKVFYEVALEKNITKAAKKLFISQPAITQTIKKLEEKLGESLFVRAHSGLNLTKFGEKVFCHVNNAILELNKIDDVVSENSELSSGSLCIGCGTNVAKYILSEAIENFLNKYPNIKFSHIDSLQVDMLNLLEIGKLDLCITQKTAKSAENFEFVKLFDETFVFVCKKNHKPQKPKFIIQAQGSHNRKIFEDYVANKKIDYEIIETAGYNMAITLAQKGLGIALVPHFLLSDSLNLIIHDKVKTIDTYGYYYNKNNFSRITQEFTKFLQSTT